MPRGQLWSQRRGRAEDRAAYYHEPFGVLSRRGQEGTLNLTRGCNAERLQLDADGGRGIPEFLPFEDAGSTARIPENGHALDTGHGVLEQLQPFAAQPAAQETQSGHVPTG